MREEDEGGGEGQEAAARVISRARLPPGWIQGDWIRSSLRQEDLDDMDELGLIVHESARLPEGETKPQP